MTSDLKNQIVEVLKENPEILKQLYPVRPTAWGIISKRLENRLKSKYEPYKAYRIKNAYIELVKAGLGLERITLLQDGQVNEAEEIIKRIDTLLERTECNRICVSACPNTYRVCRVPEKSRPCVVQHQPRI